MMKFEKLERKIRKLSFDIAETFDRKRDYSKDLSIDQSIRQEQYKNILDAMHEEYHYFIEHLRNPIIRAGFIERKADGNYYLNGEIVKPQQYIEFIELMDYDDYEMETFKIFRKYDDLKNFKFESDKYATADEIINEIVEFLEDDDEVVFWNYGKLYSCAELENNKIINKTMRVNYGCFQEEISDMFAIIRE